MSNGKSVARQLVSAACKPQKILDHAPAVLRQTLAFGIRRDASNDIRHPLRLADRRMITCEGDHVTALPSKVVDRNARPGKALREQRTAAIKILYP